MLVNHHEELGSDGLKRSISKEKVSYTKAGSEFLDVKMSSKFIQQNETVSTSDIEKQQIHKYEFTVHLVKQ